MTNTDIIKKLFLCFAKEDKEEFYHLAEEYIEQEKKKKHNIVAKELKDVLYSSKFSNKSIVGRNYKNSIPIPRDSEKGFPLVEIKEYDFDWDSLIVDEKILLILKQIVREFHDSDILATYNLKPKNKILFCGSPGTGKTFSAQIISSVLNIPLIYVRFDAIISSYLGETAANLRKVFDFIESGVWIVLFDEVDIIEGIEEVNNRVYGAVGANSFNDLEKFEEDGSILDREISKMCEVKLISSLIL